MRKQIFVTFLLCSFAFINAESTLNLDETFIVDFIHQSDATELTNSTAKPEESLKIVVENRGWSSQDVGFDAFLPSKAELISFSVSNHQGKYMAKKTNEKDAKQLLEEAKKQVSNAAIYKPQYFDGRSLDDIQINSESVHIRAQHQLTFDLEYNSNLLRGAITEEKMLDQGVIVVDLFGNNPSDLRAELTSPNYPQNYPNAANFAWLIRTQYDHKLHLNFTDVDMESCCDELVIYDGVNSSSSVLAIVSGQRKVEDNYVFESNDNALMVVLKSDCSNSGSGFRGVVSVVPEYPDISTTPSYPIDQNANCSGLHLHGSGSISSPNYPGNYSNNQNCSWMIHADYGNSIILDIYVEGVLYSDYLNIYEGSSSDVNQIGRITGSMNNYYNFFSNSNYMYITFTSDSSYTAGGFSIYYRQIEGATTVPSYPMTIESADHNANCSRVHLYGSGMIYSPNYPYDYDNNQACSWTIYGEYDKTILIDIHTYSIKSGDYLDIYDGQSIYDDRIDIITSSYNEHLFYNSTSSNMHINFTSNSYTTGQGFYISYTQVDRNTNCSGLHLHGSGVIHSPNYPYAYDNDLTCSWTIHADYGKTIKLDVYVKGVVSDDYLDIHDGSSSYDSRLARLTSRYDFSNSYNSSSNYMFVNFTTSPWGTAEGFSIYYSEVEAVVDQNANCSGVYLQGSSTIYSPNYPGNYYNNQDCSWTIYPDYSYTDMTLRVTVLGIESRYDELKIYTGRTRDSSRLLGTFYGGYSQHSFDLSGENNTYIYFTSDHSVTEDGFIIEYEESIDQNANCSGLHLHGSGSISSPNYPGNYSNNQNCSWMIHADYGNSIILDIYVEGVLYSDYLNIYDGSSSDDNRIGRITGSMNNYYNFFSNSNYMYITFTSDSSYTAGGFSISYRQIEGATTVPSYPMTTESVDQNANCSGVYLEGNGTVYSPNYPGNYSNNQNCSWLIPADIYHPMYLRVTVLEVEKRYDQLNIYSGSSNTGELLRALDGEHGPFYYYPQKNNTFIEFTSDGSVTGSGFIIEYQEDAFYD